MKRTGRTGLILLAVLLMLTACGGQKENKALPQQQHIPWDQLGTVQESPERESSLQETAPPVSREAETTAERTSAPPETKPETTTAPPETKPETTAAPPETRPETTAAPVGHLIAIDPGHQAKANNALEPNRPDSGEMKAKVLDGTHGVVTGVRESYVNLMVGLKFRDELTARGYRVLMIRTTEEVDISNKERAEMANNAGAELFLRLHCDYSGDPGRQGTSVLCQGNDRPYNAHIYSQCYRISTLLLEHICRATGGPNRGVEWRGEMTGLNWSLVPGCLVEMGFLSNAEEEARLLNEEYQLLLAKAMADAVDAYFAP